MFSAQGSVQVVAVPEQVTQGHSHLLQINPYSKYPFSHGHSGIPTLLDPVLQDLQV
jgi:hypothetical protein